MSPIVKSIRDLRASATVVVATVLAVAGAVVILVPIVRGDGPMVDKSLGAAGLLLSTAVGLLTQPARNGRATDPGGD